MSEYANYTDSLKDLAKELSAQSEAIVHTHPLIGNETILKLITNFNILKLFQAQENQFQNELRANLGREFLHFLIYSRVTKNYDNSIINAIKNQAVIKFHNKIVTYEGE